MQSGVPFEVPNVPTVPHFKFSLGTHPPVTESFFQLALHCTHLLLSSELHLEHPCGQGTHSPIRRSGWNPSGHSFTQVLS